MNPLDLSFHLIFRYIYLVVGGRTDLRGHSNSPFKELLLGPSDSLHGWSLANFKEDLIIGAPLEDGTGKI